MFFPTVVAEDVDQLAKIVLWIPFAFRSSHSARAARLKQFSPPPEHLTLLHSTIGPRAHPLHPAQRLTYLEIIERLHSKYPPKWPRASPSRRAPTRAPSSPNAPSTPMRCPSAPPRSRDIVASAPQRPLISGFLRALSSSNNNSSLLLRLLPCSRMVLRRIRIR